jgi:hypothetical protein
MSRRLKLNEKLFRQAVALARRYLEIYKDVWSRKPTPGYSFAARWVFMEKTGAERADILKILLRDADEGLPQANWILKEITCQILESGGYRPVPRPDEVESNIVVITP